MALELFISLGVKISTHMLLFEKKGKSMDFSVSPLLWALLGTSQIFRERLLPLCYLLTEHSLLSEALKQCG